MLLRIIYGLAFLGFSFQISALEDWEARHLLMRTGFEPSNQELSQFKELNRKQAISKILKGFTEPVSNLPEWHNQIEKKKRKGLSDEERKQLQKQRRQRVLELKGWWFRELIQTQNPLQEKMTLFWHNHFTSSIQKVKEPYLLLKQNQLLRKHSLGSFSTLLHEISKDPAMILYLDNQTNKKGNPNENFARELLELFTLGIGHYTEEDIKEAAKAFTGYQVNRKSGEFVLRYNLHDHSKKKFLGVEGHRLIGEDIIEILLSKKQTARHITAKILKEFISYELPARVVEKFATDFQTNKFDLAKLVRSILSSEQFWSQKNYQTMIKSPVELIVGLFRSNPVEISMLEDFKPVVQASRVMGQDIFNPPTVKGWEGGTKWITTHTYLARRQSLSRFIKHGMEMRRMSMGNPKLMGKKMKAKMQTEMREMRTALLSEEYQLK